MDKAVEAKEGKSTLRIIIPRFFKAVFKTVIVYLLYVVFSSFLIPFEGFYDYQALFTALVVSFLFFVFVIELAHGTVFQHIFSIANSLMIILYFSYVLKTGIISVTVEQINMIFDLRFFLAIFVLGGMLGFVKSMLKLLHWMNEREEQWLKYQIKSL